MWAAILCIQAQTASLTKQPETADVVGYQRVQHALPNGAPDPAAPDNYFVRVTSHYTLTGDTDRITPGTDGKRTIHIDGQSFDTLQGYSEVGRARGDLAAAFKEVFPPSDKADFKPHQMGSVSTGPVDQTVGKGFRMLYYTRLTTVEKVEIHTMGRRKATRIQSEQNYGFTTQGEWAGQIYDPAKEQVYWCQPEPEVRPDPPVYGWDRS